MRIVMGTEDPFIPASAIGDRPLGGAETAFALLAEAFARRGHAVEVCAGAEVSTAPAGIVLASRVPRVFRRLPRRGRRVLWLHNPGGYLRKPRHLLPLLAARPRLVTLGPTHSATLPRWLAFRPIEIPLAVAPPFCGPAARRAPLSPPVAVFCSNPLRGLGWLLDLWTARIRRAAPDAELHLYTGAATYGGDPRLRSRAAPVLARAAALAEAGVRLHEPVPRAALAERLRAARVMLYRGDPGETFCLALAEAQAIGLPAIVTPLGAVAERVADGGTGIVARSDDAFADAAIRLLTDDAAWSTMHAAALARGPGPSWETVAARFEALAA